MMRYAVAGLLLALSWPGVAEQAPAVDTGAALIPKPAPESAAETIRENSAEVRAPAGAQKPDVAPPPEHKPALSEPAKLLENAWVPDYLIPAYRTLTDDLLAGIRARFAEAGDVASIRLHGDCHPGNVLWTDAGPHFVDLDDCIMGPAVQDLWMLVSGRPHEQRAQLEDLLEGYGEFADFDWHELALIEPLRTLRIMHYAGWLARRWDDPAFPRAFPWFEEPKYWEQHVLDLREQLAAMQGC